MAIQTFTLIGLITLSTLAMNVALDFEDEPPKVKPQPKEFPKPSPKEEPKWVPQTPFQGKERPADSCAETQWQLKSLSADFDALKEQFEALQAENRRLKEREAMNNSDERWKAKKAELEQQIAGLTADNKKLFQDNKALNALIRKLKDDFKGLEGQVADFQSKNKELQEWKEKLLKEKDDLISIAAEWEKKFKFLLGETERLKSLGAEFVRLKRELEATNGDKADLQKQVGDLTCKLEELSQRVKSLTEDNQKLFEDNKTMAEQLKNGGKLRAKFEGLLAELDQARKANEKLLADIEDLKKLNKSYLNRLEILEAAGQKDGNDKFRDQVREFKNIIALLEKKISGLEEERRCLNAQLEEGRAKIRELAEQLAQKADECDELRRKCRTEERPSKPSLPSFPFPAAPIVPQPPREKPQQKMPSIGSSLRFSDLD